MRGIGGQSDSRSSQSLLEGRGAGVSGNTERVLRAVRKVAAAAMWPETPSLVPRPSGRAGGAILLSTACRSVAGGKPAPAQVVFVNRLQIGIIPARGQLYLPAQAQTANQRLVARLILVLQIVKQAASPTHQHQQT